MKKKTAKKAQPKAPVEEEAKENGGFFSRRGPEIFLAILIGYVILLGIGVFAEVFKIHSILNWWIWRAPGS